VLACDVHGELRVARVLVGDDDAKAMTAPSSSTTTMGCLRSNHASTSSLVRGAVSNVAMRSAIPSL
jgi:hypothetical protein